MTYSPVDLYIRNVIGSCEFPLPCHFYIDGRLSVLFFTFALANQLFSHQNDPESPDFFIFTVVYLTRYVKTRNRNGALGKRRDSFARNRFICAENNRFSLLITFLIGSHIKPAYEYALHKVNIPYLSIFYNQNFISHFVSSFR